MDFDLETEITRLMSEEITAEVNRITKNTINDMMHLQLKADVKDIGFDIDSIYKLFIEKEYFTLNFNISIVAQTREYSILLQTYDRRLSITQGKLTLSEITYSAVEGTEVIEERFTFLSSQDRPKYNQVFNDLMASIENKTRQSLDELFYGTVSYIH